MKIINSRFMALSGLTPATRASADRYSFILSTCAHMYARDDGLNCASRRSAKGSLRPLLYTGHEWGTDAYKPLFKRVRTRLCKPAHL